jgi:hypothetical protein
MGPSRFARPHLVVVAGTDGACKTTLLDLLRDLVVGERIDPDLIARSIDEANPARAALGAGRPSGIHSVTPRLPEGSGDRLAAGVAEGHSALA